MSRKGSQKYQSGQRRTSPFDSNDNGTSCDQNRIQQQGDKGQSSKTWNEIPQNEKCWNTEEHERRSEVNWFSAILGKLLCEESSMETIPRYLFEMWTKKKSSVMIDNHIWCVESLLSDTVDKVSTKFGVLAGPIC